MDKKGKCDKKQTWSCLVNKNYDAELSSWPKLSQERTNGDENKKKQIKNTNSNTSGQQSTPYDNEQNDKRSSVIADSENGSIDSNSNSSAQRREQTSGSNDCTGGINKECNSSANDKHKKERLPQSWKTIRLLAKEEKRRKREENIRRSRISPKSEHFRIIDSNFKDMVVSAGEGSSSANVSGFELSQTFAEFPELQSTNRSKGELNKKILKHNSTSGPHVSVVDSNENIGSKQIDKPPTKQVIVNKADVEKNKSNPRKRIRRSTPIEFDLINALQLVQAKHAKQNSQIKSTKRLTRTLAKKHGLSGNQLDADNPIRRKGKYRENKKRKYTKLKRCLLNERLIRRCIMNDSNKALESEKKICINSILDKGLVYRLTSDVQHDKELNVSNSEVDDVKARSVDPKSFIHTRNFRHYCDQWPSSEMQENVCSLIRTLVRFQDRHHTNDPIKAHAKRRFVCGFHEVMRFVKVNKAKLIIITTDIDCGNAEEGGSLLECINQLTASADAFSIPCVFSGTRWSIRTAFKKKRPISCSAILNYEGAEELYKNIIGLLPTVKITYQEKLKAAEAACGITDEVKEDVTNACIQSMLDRLTINDYCDDDVVSGTSNSDAILLTEEKGDDCPFMNAILKFNT